MNLPGPSRGGHSDFCAGCAIRWIALRYGDSDFAYDPKTYKVNMPDRRTTRDQDVNENTGGKFPENLFLTFAQYGLTLNKGRVTQEKKVATGTILRKAGLAAEGCYYISLRSFTTRHAVAMQNMGSRGWRFFDANYGEFRAKNDAEFETVIDWYWAATGYKTDFAASTSIVSINPPPYTGATFDQSVKDLIKKFGG